MAKAGSFVLISHGRYPYSDSGSRSKLKLMGSQQPLEMILLRQLVRHLATPVWIMDAAGELVFFNEPAEVALGVEFSEIGALVDVDLTEMFTVEDLDENPLPQEEFPVFETFSSRLPASRRVRFLARDDVWRIVDVMSMPIIVHGERFLGVFTVFWPAEP